MKRVSFEVAKAIKEAGYPQDRKDVGYVIERCSDRFNVYNVYYEGVLTDNASRMVKKVSAPYVMEVWLWLAKEKQTHIDVSNNYNGSVCTELYIGKERNFIRDFTEDNIEDAIKAAIDYLLLK